MQTVTQVTFRRWIAHDCTIFAALLSLCERQADQNRNLSDKNDTYPTELWFQQHKTQIWISTTKMGFRQTKERGNWNFTLAGLFWIDSPWTRLIVFRLSWRTVLMFIIYFIIFLDAQKGTVIMQESTEALKLHLPFRRNGDGEGKKRDVFQSEGILHQTGCRVQKHRKSDRLNMYWNFVHISPNREFVTSGMLGMLNLEVEADKVSKFLTGTWISGRKATLFSGVLVTGDYKKLLRTGPLEMQKASSRDRLLWRLPLVAWQHPDAMQMNSEYLSLKLVPAREKKAVIHRSDVIRYVRYDKILLRRTLKESYLSQPECAESFAAHFSRLQTIWSDDCFFCSGTAGWTGCRGTAPQPKASLQQLVV